MRVALLALSVAALLHAQAGVETPAAGPARLVLDAPGHTFGKVAAGTRVTHGFLLRNDGGAPLEIGPIIPTCGCTVGQLEKNRLLPGESTRLEVTLNTAGLTGAIHKTLFLRSSDPATPERILTLAAEVVQAVTLSREDVFFQGLGPKDRRKASVKVTSQTGQAIRVTAVDLSEAPWLGVATREEGADLQVDLELLARSLPAEKGAGTDLITLHLENPALSVVPLRVHWEKRLAVFASPARVAWTGAAGQERRAKVLLRHREGRSFRIRSARTSNPLLRVTGLAPGAAVRQAIQVVLAPEAKPGVYDETVFLSLDEPGGQELAIRVLANLTGVGD